MFRLSICLLLCALLSIPAGAAHARPFTDYLDPAIAAFEARGSSGTLNRVRQQAVDRALRILAKPHDRLSQDLRTGFKVCILAAHYLPRDRELFEIIDAGLEAMEDEVVTNRDALGLVLADSTLTARQQTRRSNKLTRQLRKAEQIDDPALKARRFARIQASIERLLARYGA